MLFMEPQALLLDLFRDSGQARPRLGSKNLGFEHCILSFKPYFEHWMHRNITQCLWGSLASRWCPKLSVYKAVTLRYACFWRSPDLHSNRSTSRILPRSCYTVQTKWTNNCKSKSTPYVFILFGISRIIFFTFEHITKVLIASWTLSPQLIMAIAFCHRTSICIFTFVVCILMSRENHPPSRHHRRSTMNGSIGSIWYFFCLPKGLRYHKNTKFTCKS